MIKRLLQNLVLKLARKDFNFDRLRKIQVKSIYSYIILTIVFGLTWHFKYSDNLIGFSVSLRINNPVWWTLIIIQNSLNFFMFYLVKTNIYYRDIYRDKLLKEDCVMVGFHDDTFKLGKTYKVLSLDDIRRTPGPMPSEFFTGNIIKDNNGEVIPIMGDKIFKFISIKENRRLKLEKLKRK